MLSLCHTLANTIKPLPILCMKKQVEVKFYANSMHLEQKLGKCYQVSSEERRAIPEKEPMMDQSDSNWNTNDIGTMEQALERVNIAKEENLAKSKFLAELGHELRTPLNGLLGMVELILESEDQEQRREYAEFARRCGDMIQDLVDAMLEFSQLEAGEIPTVTKAFKPADLFRDVERLMQPMAEAKKLWLKFQLDDSTPTELRGDESRIRQVLLNLVSNSIKFTSKGQVSVKLDVLGKSSKSLMVRFSVSDTGCGVSHEMQQRIFLPYFKGDPLRKDGSGLGLSISKQIVRRLGGKMGLESKPGMGSMFWFELPLGLSIQA